jgi:hypothetical protein
MHYKRDIAKTTIPCMRVITKYTAELGHLPINVIGMVTHKYGDGVYAHYSIDCWS